MKNFLGIAAVAAVLAVASAACSANGGFGSPVPPAPPNAPIVPQGALSPAPSSADPNSSASPGPTESPTTIYLDSTVLRAAYDGSAANPVKASRLLEVTFDFKNPTADADSMASVNIAADDDKTGTHTDLKLPIPANRSSDVAVAAVALKQDLAKVKHITLSFVNDAGDELASTTVNPPGLALTYTPLDDKQPAGSLSVVGLDFSRVTAPGSGPHYECTFGLVNASGAKISIDSFTVTPPKGSPAKLAIPVTLAARTSSSLITIVLPFSGKSLPTGKYSVTVTAGNNALAQATTGLL